MCAFTFFSEKVTGTNQMISLALSAVRLFLSLLTATVTIWWTTPPPPSPPTPPSPAWSNSLSKCCILLYLSIRWCCWTTQTYLSLCHVFQFVQDPCRQLLTLIKQQSSYEYEWDLRDKGQYLSSDESKAWGKNSGLCRIWTHDHCDIGRE